VVCSYEGEAEGSPTTTFDTGTTTFSVNVPESETVRCIVTNTYVPPEGTLIIEKRVTNYEGDWSFDFSGSVEGFTLSNSSTSEERRSYSSWINEQVVPEGITTITEVQKQNWEMTSVVCSYEGEAEGSPTTTFDTGTTTFSVNVPDG